MIRRPPRSTLSSSSAASDVYKRQVPEDCSVIGFDDVPHAALSTPAITTIRQPMLEMGSLATTLVLDDLAASEPHAPAKNLLHMMPPLLVQRDSTKPCAKE